MQTVNSNVTPRTCCSTPDLLRIFNPDLDSEVQCYNCGVWLCKAHAQRAGVDKTPDTDSQDAYTAALVTLPFLSNWRGLRPGQEVPEHYEDLYTADMRGSFFPLYINGYGALISAYARVPSVYDLIQSHLHEDAEVPGFAKKLRQAVSDQLVKELLSHFNEIIVKNSVAIPENATPKQIQDRAPKVLELFAEYAKTSLHTRLPWRCSTCPNREAIGNALPGIDDGMAIDNTAA